MGTSSCGSSLGSGCLPSQGPSEPWSTSPAWGCPLQAPFSQGPVRGVLCPPWVDLPGEIEVSATQGTRTRCGRGHGIDPGPRLPSLRPPTHTCRAPDMWLLGPAEPGGGWGLASPPHSWWAPGWARPGRDGRYGVGQLCLPLSAGEPSSAHASRAARAALPPAICVCVCLSVSACVWDVCVWRVGVCAVCMNVCEVCVCTRCIFLVVSVASPGFLKFRELGPEAAKALGGG